MDSRRAKRNTTRTRVQPNKQTHKNTNAGSPVQQQATSSATTVTNPQPSTSFNIPDMAAEVSIHHLITLAKSPSSSTTDEDHSPERSSFSLPRSIIRRSIAPNPSDASIIEDICDDDTERLEAAVDAAKEQNVKPEVVNDQTIPIESSNEESMQHGQQTTNNNTAEPQATAVSQTESQNDLAAENINSSLEQQHTSLDAQKTNDIIEASSIAIKLGRHALINHVCSDTVPLELDDQVKIFFYCEPYSCDFNTRVITLTPGTKVIVGRAIGQNRPATTNAIFNCMVISRNHATIWYSEDGKFMLQDSGSANGTFINEEPLGEDPEELISGDIIRFGVDVLESTRKDVHNSVIASIKLHDPTKQSAGENQKKKIVNEVRVSCDDLNRLQLYLKESGQREKTLKAKVASLQNAMNEMSKTSTLGWQVILHEDQLLHYIRTLEQKLEFLVKEVPDSDLKAEVLKLIEDKHSVKAQTNDSLRKAHEERRDAMELFSNLERMYQSAENELTARREETENNLKTMDAMQKSFDALQAQYRHYKETSERMLKEVSDQMNDRVVSLLEQLRLRSEEVERLTIECENNAKKNSGGQCENDEKCDDIDAANSSSDSSTPLKTTVVEIPESVQASASTTAPVEASTSTADDVVMINDSVFPMNFQNLRGFERFGNNLHQIYTFLSQFEMEMNKVKKVGLVQDDKTESLHWKKQEELLQSVALLLQEAYHDITDDTISCLEVAKSDMDVPIAATIAPQQSCHDNAEIPPINSFSTHEILQLTEEANFDCCELNSDGEDLIGEVVNRAPDIIEEVDEEHNKFADKIQFLYEQLAITEIKNEQVLSSMQQEIEDFKQKVAELNQVIETLQQDKIRLEGSLSVLPNANLPEFDENQVIETLQQDKIRLEGSLSVFSNANLPEFDENITIEQNDDPVEVADNMALDDVNTDTDEKTDSDEETDNEEGIDDLMDSEELSMDSIPCDFEESDMIPFNPDDDNLNNLSLSHDDDEEDFFGNYYQEVVKLRRRLDRSNLANAYLVDKIAQLQLTRNANLRRPSFFTTVPIIMVIVLAIISFFRSLVIEDYN